MPPNELNTTTYTEEINQIYEQRLKTHGVRMEVIKGHELRDRGFGGLWGVGKVRKELDGRNFRSYNIFDIHIGKRRTSTRSRDSLAHSL